MCRFLAYIGPEPIYIDQLIDHDNNSMIKQSREAHEGRTKLNADGFGVGWCNETMDSAPALYRSVLPAWNDQNLQDLARSIRSSCFFGHVRASTVGDVGISNCHPFTSQRYMFVHNGTVEQFSQIKRKILNAVSDEILAWFKTR